jgi:DNA-binding GntR family transcriptional regulator
MATIATGLPLARAQRVEGPALTRPRMVVDPYVLDTLMRDLVRHDRAPSAYLVYLQLFRRTHGAGAPSVSIALLDLAESTGLSKRSVQSAVAHLVYRRLIMVRRASVTSVPEYTVLRPWRR